MRSRFSSADRTFLDQAIRRAETATRLEISVYVGPVLTTAREFAQQIHALMAAPDTSVLVLVSVDAQVVEIVTGRYARLRLRDQAALRAATTMLHELRAGRVCEAIASGLGVIEHAGGACSTDVVSHGHLNRAS